MNERNIKILLVDDSPTQMLECVALLSDDMFIIQTASDACIALKILKSPQSLPDIIISDIVMPEINGIEFCKIVKRDFPAVPFIVFTSHNDEENLKNAFLAGASDYILKPFNKTELKMRVLNALKMLHYKNEISEKEIAGGLLEAKKNEAETIIDSIAHKIRVIDLNYNVIKVNQAFADMLGQEKQDLEGRKCYDILPGKQCDTSRCPVCRMVTRKKHFRTEVDKRIVRKGGINSFSASITPLFDQKHNLYGIVESFTDITKEKKIRQGLHFFRDLLKSSNDMIFVIDPKSSAFIDCSISASKNLGYSLKELRYMRVIDIEEVSPSIYDWKNLVQRLRKNQSMILKGSHKRKDGSVFPVEVSCSIKWYNQQEYVTAIVRDISEREHVLRLLEESKEKLSLALSGANLGCWDWNIKTGELRLDNVWEEMIGYKPGELSGNVTTWQSLLHPADRHTTMLKVEKHFRKPEWDYIAEFRLKTKDGLWKWIQARGRVCSFDEAGNPLRMIGVHLDINRRKILEKKIRVYNRKLKKLAYFDSLTQVLNREPFVNAVDNIIARDKRNYKDKKLAFLFIDLDKFKAINDAFGHKIGDEVLKSVAKKLKLITRKSDFICRLGGDEFVVCCSDISSKNDVSMIAGGIEDKLNEKIIIDGNELRIEVSIGVALYPDDGENVSKLLTKSDFAMYKAKKTGGGKLCFYNDDFN